MILLGLPQAGEDVGGGLFPDPALYPSPTLFPSPPVGQALGSVTLWGVEYDYSGGVPWVLAKCSAFLDGLGGSSQQNATMDVYDEDSSLLGQSDPVAVVPGQEPGWVDFRFPALGDDVFAPGRYIFALWGDATGDCARMLQVPAAQVRHDYGQHCTFVMQPQPLQPSYVGSWSTLTSGIPIFATAFEPWEPPENVDDMYLGRLPWGLAQRAFGAAPQLRHSAVGVVQARVGWHGVNFDVETGAFAIARKGGACEALVGERLFVVRRRGPRQRVAAVYCYALRVFPDEIADEDLSLTRRAFLAISGWEQDTVSALVVPNSATAVVG